MYNDAILRMGNGLAIAFIKKAPCNLFTSLYTVKNNFDGKLFERFKPF